MKLKAIILSMALTISLSALSIGENPKEITLSGENGGLVAGDGATWNSNTIKDKIYVMFYVDPDEKDTNNQFSAELKRERFDRTKYGSMAIINLAATWKPNFAIESILKDKQLEFPHTIYVKDKKSVLVNEWKIEDDASNIIIFAKDGKVLFYKSGAMSETDIKDAIKLIKDNL